MHEKILKQIESQAQRENLPIIGSERGEVLAGAINKYAPQSVLEVGTLVGYSAILMAQYLPENGHIISIEKNPAAAEQARENIQKAGFEDKISVLVGDAREIIPTLNSIFDLLFLDGEKDQYFEYLKLAEVMLSPKAVVIADNVQKFSDRMQNYLQYVSNREKFKSEIWKFYTDAIEVSIKLS